MRCGIGHKCSSDPALLWRRPAATPPIRPLAWQPPYAAGVAQKEKRKKKRHFGTGLADLIVTGSAK